MRKILLLLLVIAAGCLRPPRAHAQFIGYNSPQTVQKTIAQNLNCTGSPQLFISGAGGPDNLGQTQHYLSVASVVGAQKFQAEIDGIDRQGNVFRISDILEPLSGNVTGSGYFPQIQIQITCSPTSATFTASYSGASSTPNVLVGSYLIAAIDKVNFNQAPANTSVSDVGIQTPFGSAAGTLQFQYNTTSIAGSTLAVLCKSNGLSTFQTVFLTTLANTTALQAFQIPDTYCPFMNVQYTTGGGGANTMNTEYVFSFPGREAPAFQFTHVTGTTATAVKASPGYLHTLTINTGGAGTISIFDLASASCTGTPSTNVVAVITAVGTSLTTLTYDVNFLNGICVKASAAMDFTVSAQ